MRHIALTASLILVAGLAPAPALACSDLPNICAAQAQHYREQIDIAATPPWGGDEEEVYQAEERNSAPTYRYSPAEWAELLEKAREGAIIQQRMRNEEHEQRLRDDPRYRRFFEGYWLEQGKDVAEKGGSCIAHFARQGQGVLVMGPSRDQNQAFLGFYGVQLAAPKKTETISVTLRQTGDPAQKVKVFYAKNPWDKDMGMIFFAVPTIDAAIAGMTDQLRFDVEHDEITVLGLEWHGGLKAAETLKACVAAQRGG